MTLRKPESTHNAVSITVPGFHYINDFERCEDLQRLETVMETINRNQYQLISVTQDSGDVYTVFFRRCVIV